MPAIHGSDVATVSAAIVPAYERDLSTAVMSVDSDRRRRNDLPAPYVVDANGRNGAWWCREHDQIGGFAWSPDGTRIATVSQTPKLGYHRVTSSIDICTAAGAQTAASSRVVTAWSEEIWGSGGPPASVIAYS